ncbi:MAG: hypothetical protein E7262_11285 [Lachnospiraceae bacterium]|nr:hypothetical protein [Lachnospiraceae bacterium]
MTKSIEKNINKLLKGKNKKYVSAAVGIILVAMFILLIVNLTVQRTYDSYSIVKTKARTDSSTKGYLRHNENIIKYSEDGITVMTNNLKTIWNASYSFKNPHVVTSEKYIAVADIGGKDIHVYDNDGGLEKIENSRQICQVEISDTGMVAIMAKEKMAYYITIANSTKKYIDIKTRIKEDGYPIDMAFSGDSQKLVTAYMNVNNGEVNNYVTFYNFGEVGKNYESKIVKADSYGSVMVPKVEFMDEDTVCIFSGERFIVYEMKEIPEEKFKSEKYSKMIKSVLCSKDYIGLISDDESGAESVIKLYSKDGRKKLSKKFKFNYETVEIINDDIVFNNGTEGLVIRTSGKVKFQGEFKEEVEHIIPYNNRDKFIFITPQNIDRVKFTN